MPASAELWRPIDLGPVRVKNRVAAGATTLLYGEDGVLSDRHLAYYRERAMGGVGLQLSEQHAAHEHGRGAFAQACSAWDPRAVARFAALAEIVHAHDCRQFIQLWSPGAKNNGTLGTDDWRPVWGPSARPALGYGDSPRAVGKAELAELIDGFAVSASNVLAGGLDGVELHASHGWLLGQFLSPLYNDRADEFGGSLENRCRLVLAIAEEIRARVDRSLALGVQLSVDEYVGDAGLTPADTLEQLELLADAGLFDYFHLSTGSPNSGHRTIPPMGAPDAFLASFGAEAKRVIGDRAKLMLVGRIRDLETAARLLDEGAADLVAMTRAHIADPFLVAKARGGRGEETVPCVGVNHCMKRVAVRRPVTCMMNPVTGREQMWGAGTLDRTQAGLRILVVGGGPAGMKCAATAARRGHAVELLERASELGGRLRLEAAFPRREGWQQAIDALESELRRFGVMVHRGAEAGPDLVARFGADLVVCATGASWDRTGFTVARADRRRIDGVERPEVVDLAAAALDGFGAIDGHVVIVDDTGEYAPLGLAEVLAGAGARVTIVTPRARIGEEAAPALELPYVLPVLARLDVQILAGHLLESIGDAGVEVVEQWSGRRRVLPEVGRVVLAMGRSPEDGLARALQERGMAVHVIGDALAPRSVDEAMFDAERLARSL
jgi:2,4-dienoyl-CoA reductase-like NADH-dependent reductase (Old Yellow Enzyme family)